MRARETTKQPEVSDAPLADTTDTASALKNLSSISNRHAVANLAVFKNRVLLPKESYWHAADCKQLHGRSGKQRLFELMIRVCIRERFVATAPCSPSLAVNSCTLTDSVCHSAVASETEFAPQGTLSTSSLPLYKHHSFLSSRYHAF